MALGTTETVAALLGLATLDPEQERLASVLLGLAEGKLLARIPGVLLQADESETYADLVAGIESEAVARVLRNPEGYRSEGVGPWNYTLDTRAAAGFLTILDDEWTDLGHAPKGGAFTIDTVMAAPVLAPGWGQWPGAEGWA